jgi:hypothetical protein
MYQVKPDKEFNKGIGLKLVVVVVVGGGGLVKLSSGVK